jgi:hypothetical protein
MTSSPCHGTKPLPSSAGLQPLAKGGNNMANRDPSNELGQADLDPRPAAVSFVTTEHFTLHGARSPTIAEATGRATMFLDAVSGGLHSRLQVRVLPGAPGPAGQCLAVDGRHVLDGATSGPHG